MKSFLKFGLVVSTLIFSTTASAQQLVHQTRGSQAHFPRSAPRESKLQLKLPTLNRSTQLTLSVAKSIIAQQIGLGEARENTKKRAGIIPSYVSASVSFDF